MPMSVVVSAKRRMLAPHKRRLTPRFRRLYMICSVVKNSAKERPSEVRTVSISQTAMGTERVPYRVVAVQLPMSVLTVNGPVVSGNGTLVELSAGPCRLMLGKESGARCYATGRGRCYVMQEGIHHGSHISSCAGWKEQSFGISQVCRGATPEKKTTTSQICRAANPETNTTTMRGSPISHFVHYLR
ncbi:hypothetical protein CALVIDRAFT_378370 [Calocera viscosa TUFC12733]|uniref:Uncharacterized protein n=1 Tax=Calocera viscosa (strain TUFC12733) TaxID=1330018 RepID=A0A167Q2B9_CALVF|nr:hypothetical protein CALVIDRAFT_378370 [Calocera viscosa TUFC12733]